MLTTHAQGTISRGVRSRIVGDLPWISRRLGEVDDAQLSILTTHAQGTVSRGVRSRIVGDLPWISRRLGGSRRRAAFYTYRTRTGNCFESGFWSHLEGVSFGYLSAWEANRRCTAAYTYTLDYSQLYIFVGREAKTAAAGSPPSMQFLVFWPLLALRRWRCFSALRSALVVYVLCYERYTKQLDAASGLLATRWRLWGQSDSSALRSIFVV